MKRSWRHFAVALAVPLFVAGSDVGFANVQYNFNNSAEGWEFGTILPLSGTTPYWEQVSVSSTGGALQSFLVESGSGAGAWAMSPCLEVTNATAQGKIHVDMFHYTAFPLGILGQVQFRLDVTGTSGWGAWQGISGTSWLTSLDNHVPPTEANVFPPLLTSSTTSLNEWLAFSGTHNPSTDPDASTASGQHVKSAFDLWLSEYGLSNGSEIQFRLMVGVNEVFTPPLSPPKVLWELDDFQIVGVKECAAVPEPGTLALAGSAIGCGRAGLARQRRRRRAGRVGSS
ncbi:MAG: PEP-CTERM sorting domain-containing protein [Planctomycetaceae bacterium]